MTIYTIGFTKRSAKDFFQTLRKSGAKHLLDVRLNNKSQLAGFTKRDDLKYFLEYLADMDYHEVPGLAPDETILKEYRKTRDWAAYERRYNDLLESRQPERQIETKLFKDGVVLLCSEPQAIKCHRRLAAEYLLKAKALDMPIVHL